MTDLPFPLRTILSRVDIRSVVDEISNGWIPRFLNSGDPAACLPYQIYRHIMRAALDPSSTHAAEITEAAGQFNMPWEPFQEIRLDFYSPANLPCEVNEVMPTRENHRELRDHEDQQREMAATSSLASVNLTGEAINPLDVAEIVPPESDEVKTCGHRFCLDCLGEIVNAVYVGKDEVPCPCCRKERQGSLKAFIGLFKEIKMLQIDIMRRDYVLTLMYIMAPETLVARRHSQESAL
ncbi:hypothetical protein FB567DRAFT_177101 [Paraphoma chrysanthemicola]|uniref:RING-type domain-containing protein n=1 Tax=Paraphoma chrysanthemicola TaxID=798071 RepID=A0A8K0RFE3_9PLEO|nr:hypothetical protein FB567DRAFT_177101 [Paraphoma chrysanthemicola]